MENIFIQLHVLVTRIILDKIRQDKIILFSFVTCFACFVFKRVGIPLYFSLGAKEKLDSLLK